MAACKGTIPSEYPLYVGLDLSLSSPGISIVANAPSTCTTCETHTEHGGQHTLLQLFCIPVRKKDRSKPVVQKEESNYTWSITSFVDSSETPENKYTISSQSKKKNTVQKDVDKMQKQLHLNSRYRSILRFLQFSLERGRAGALEWQNRHFCDCTRRREGCKKLFVCIEGYAYNANMGGSAKLHELGGIVKQYLYDHNIAFLEVSPTSAKKFFTGKGSADKLLMYKHFQKRFAGLDLMSTFGYSEPPPSPSIKPTTTSSSVIEEEHHKIPNPVQDLVDATALALRAQSCFSKLIVQKKSEPASTITTKNKPTLRKKRKRISTFFQDLEN